MALFEAKIGDKVYAFPFGVGKVVDCDKMIVRVAFPLINDTVDFYRNGVVFGMNADIVPPSATLEPMEIKVSDEQLSVCRLEQTPDRTQTRNCGGCGGCKGKGIHLNKEDVIFDDVVNAMKVFNDIENVEDDDPWKCEKYNGKMRLKLFTVGDKVTKAVVVDADTEKELSDEWLDTFAELAFMYGCMKHGIYVAIEDLNADTRLCKVEVIVEGNDIRVPLPKLVNIIYDREELRKIAGPVEEVVKMIEAIKDEIDKAAEAIFNKIGVAEMTF